MTPTFPIFIPYYGSKELAIQILLFLKSKIPANRIYTGIVGWLHPNQDTKNNGYMIYNGDEYVGRGILLTETSDGKIEASANSFQGGATLVTYDNIVNFHPDIFGKTEKYFIEAPNGALSCLGSFLKRPNLKAISEGEALEYYAALERDLGVKYQGVAESNRLYQIAFDRKVQATEVLHKEGIC